MKKTILIILIILNLFLIGNSFFNKEIVKNNKSIDSDLNIETEKIHKEEFRKRVVETQKYLEEEEVNINLNYVIEGVYTTMLEEILIKELSKKYELTEDFKTVEELIAKVISDLKVEETESLTYYNKNINEFKKTPLIDYYKIKIDKNYKNKEIVLLHIKNQEFKNIEKNENLEISYNQNIMKGFLSVIEEDILFNLNLGESKKIEQDNQIIVYSIVKKQDNGFYSFEEVKSVIDEILFKEKAIEKTREIKQQILEFTNNSKNKRNIS